MKLQSPYIELHNDRDNGDISLYGGYSEADDCLMFIVPRSSNVYCEGFSSMWEIGRADGVG